MDIMSVNMQPWALMSPSGDYYKISEPNFFIGRDEGLDLTLKSRSVDKKHAVITIQGNQHEMHDLGSLNGTFVNEKRVKKQPVQLGLRDTIRFGYVCSGKDVVFGPKWIGIEENLTLSDLLRYSTGDQFTTRTIQVIVSSETSVKDVSQVNLTIPVTDLEDKDKKLVSFILQPDEKALIKKTYRIDLYPLQNTNQSYLETKDENQNQPVHDNNNIYSKKSYDAEDVFYQQQTSCVDQDTSTGHQPTPPAHDMSYCMHPTSPYPLHHQVVPHHHPSHYPPHGYPISCHAPVPPQQSRCTCPHCNRGLEPHSPHGSPVDHVIPGYYGYHGNPYYEPTVPPAGYNRPNIERPMSVHGDRYDAMVKGAPLYGQPPWWGWGAAEEEPHQNSGPHAALAAHDRGDTVTAQRMLALHQQKLINEGTSSPKRHSIGTYAVLKESQEKIYTQMAHVSPNALQEYHSVASLNSSRRKEPLSSMYERSPSTGEWEYNMRQRNLEVDQAVQFEDCDHEEDRFTDRRGRQTPQSMSFEISMIPEYGEIPEKPVSEKSTSRPQNDGKVKPDRRSVIRSKTITKSKRPPRPMSDTETCYRTKKSSERRYSATSLVSDTSESECERSFRGRSARPDAAVFGLTEVSLDQINGRDKGQVLPKWVEQWARTMQSENDSGRTCTRGPSADSTRDSRSSTPRTPRSTRSTLNRSHTGETSEPKHSDPKAATLPRNFRSRGAPVSRMRMSTGSDVESKKSGRSRSMISSTSDDSEGERSDTSFSSSTHFRTSGYSTPERDNMSIGGSRRATPRPSSAPVTLPRGNKTTMLRALNSREAIKSSSTKPTSKTKHSRHSSGGTPTEERVAPTHSNVSSRSWTPNSKRTSKSPSSSSVTPRKGSAGRSSTQGVQRRGLSQSDRDTQAAVEALFSSSTRALLPDDFQMSRGDKTNKTFVLEDGIQQTSLDARPPEKPTSDKEIKNNSSLTHDHDTDSSTSSSDLDKAALIKALTELKTDKSKGKKMRQEGAVTEKSCPAAPRWSVSPESKPTELRPVSPDSLVSVPPAASPSPPSTPRSSAKKVLQGKSNGLSASLSRRQWDVTEKPVEDLMLASIHAFTVELRLASDSALTKLRTLYEQGVDGSNGVSTNDSFKLHAPTTSDGKQEHQSSIPDWKSSHAEIAGVFRNLRHVEFSLRTMDQALSVLCSDHSPKEIQKERKLGVIEEPNKSPHKWNDFKVRARRSSWAVEHRDKFPGPPSDDEDDDTS